MPLSIANVPATITADGSATAVYKFPSECMLLGVEADNNYGPALASVYLRNSGTVQCMGIPLSQRGPGGVLSEDIKMPVSPGQEVVCDWSGATVGATVWLKVTFYIGNLERVGWWQ